MAHPIMGRRYLLALIKAFVIKILKLLFAKSLNYSYIVASARQSMGITNPKFKVQMLKLFFTFGGRWVWEVVWLSPAVP